MNEAQGLSDALQKISAQKQCSVSDFLKFNGRKLHVVKGDGSRLLLDFLILIKKCLPIT